MSAIQLALIFGPVLIVAILVSYLTRDDPLTAESIQQVQSSPLNRLSAVISCIAGPVMVVALLNNLFGAFLLIVSGLLFVFQDKLYSNLFWIRGLAAKAIGVVYLVLGLFMAFYHVA